MHPIRIDTFDLAIASLLVLFDAGLSIAAGLQLHRQVLWAAVRMVVQLVLVGYVLRAVFSLNSPAATLGIVVLMIVAAAREVAVRPAHRLKRGMHYQIAAVVVSASSLGTVLLGLLTALRPSPWYDAHYAIPLMGIVLGSVLNAASLGMDSFLTGAVDRRAAIEARLALGATAREALADITRDAIRKGLIPIINQMSAAGIITLPGVMTGQILAGMDPLDAVRYQILLMFLLTGGAALASAGAVFFAARTITDERQRLRLDRIVGR